MPYTLTVNFNLASPDPGSYRVKFWPASDPSNITTRMVSNSPFLESNLSETSYAGTIEASCGGGNYSSPVSFSSSVPVTNLYLLAQEVDLGAGTKGIKWLLSTTPGASSGNTTVPFDIRLTYWAEGTNINGGATTSPITVSGLELIAANQEVNQGTNADNWTNIHTVGVSFREGGISGTWTSFTSVISPTGVSISQPLTFYYTGNGTIYSFTISINSLAVI